MSDKSEDFTLKSHKFSKKQKLILIAVAVFVATTIAVVLILMLAGKRDDTPATEGDNVSTETPPAPTVFYSTLTGEEIVRSGAQDSGLSYSVREAETIAAAYNSSPLFCIQIPNGMDGARPHAGLNEAKVVFEAIAEAGITRFAAIFREPTATAIGPIRSLRSYYLDWDTPFDCTIIHAGGEENALVEVSSGYKHLSESTTYMWRTGWRYVGGKALGYAAPNNLFSDATLLKKFNADSGFTTSNPKVWPRLTPEESAAQRTPATTTETDTESNAEPAASSLATATSIHVRYGSVPGYNPVYTYNPETNTYLRAYESGEPHTYYICESGSQPRPEEDCGQAVQVAPSVVIVMKVQESLNQINHYREVIQTVGSGEAWIFQNGRVIPATWTKSSKAEQIKFTDASGAEIALAPGQTWISAIPISVGRVTYE